MTSSAPRGTQNLPPANTETPRFRSGRGLSRARMISATMRYDWRVAVAVALGVATATAVIVGALLVGDSMRGSLRELTIDRLGRIETAIIPGMFFEFAGIAEPDLGGAPLILFESGVVESKQPDGSVRRTGLVQVIGCDDSFWKLQINPEDAPTGILDDQSVILNEATAIELGVREGDQVTVRLPKEQAVPADSPLGRRESESEGLPRMRVARIIADRGFGRFSLAPNQASPRNVFLNRETVAQALDRPGQANIMLFDRQISADALRIRLRDLGLAVREVRKAHPGADGSSQTVFNYFSLTSDRLLLPEVAVQRILREFSPAEVAPVSTYLANAIEQIDEDGQVIASVPYSIMTAMDARDDFPLDFTAPEDSELGGRIPVVLNSWAADRLKASRGTRLRVAFFEPEVENGQEVERTFEAIVTSVVPITEPSAPYRRRQEPTFDQPPTVYNDPDLTPTVPGVTDQDSINDWDLPFQLNREISRDDDAYWNNHRLTPKLFMALRDGERLFASRFGRTTGLRFTGDVAADRESLEQRLMATLTPVLPELGWSPRLIRQQQLAASRGTTPFDGLFLALSAFVIFSAVMLIAMLFRLGFVQRMRQYGMMLAVGWNRSRVGGLAMGEGLCIALAGVAVGMIGGVLYAIAVLWALRSWWVGAVTVPFLSFHWSARSLLIGSLAGWLVTAFTLWLSTRSLLRGSAQSLLAQRETDAGIGLGQSRGGTRARLLAGLIGLGALVLAAVGARAGGQLAAGAFVGGGMMLLIALLLALYVRLRQPRRITIGTDIGGYTLISLAMRSAARHPLRSTLTIGLMSSASFLIIAIAAFRLQPTDSGTGGFELIGQTAQPLYRDLRDKTVQAELLGADQKGMQGVVVQPWRLRPGQDASCNNLYQASQPTVLGVPESFSRTLVESSLPGFQWAASIQTEPNQTPWDALNRTASGSAEQPIPVVIDQNTAMWSLQMTRGIGERRAFQYRDGEPIHFEVVGLLANSMLQGKLLIGESNFEQLFPEVSGYRYFLFACDRREAAGVAKILENRLGDVGMDVSETHQVLSGMLAVQNTYLRTFQSLGALGLLLGTIGLAVAQLRSVLERRQELAVLRAIGFTRGRLSSVVMLETGGLLALGIGCGVLCAVLAVLPHAVLGGFLPPIGEPLLLTAVILGLGLLAGLLAVRRVATLPLLESLRSE